jgi:hypothetical protein
MVYKLSILLVLVAVVSVFAGEQDVLDLTDGDFNTRLKEPEQATTLVMFYAPW